MCHFTFLLTVHKSSSFSIPLPEFVTLCLFVWFDSNHFVGYDVMSHVALICISLIINNVNIFSYTFWPYFFGNMSSQVICQFFFICQFFNQVLLLVSCENSSYVYMLSLLLVGWFANIFSYRLPFHSVDYFLCCIEVFKFDVVQYEYFFTSIACDCGALKKKLFKFYLL